MPHNSDSSSIIDLLECKKSMYQSLFLTFKSGERSVIFSLAVLQAKAEHALVDPGSHQDIVQSLFVDPQYLP